MTPAPARTGVEDGLTARPFSILADEVLEMGVEPCGTDYRAVDLKVKSCGRPRFHDGIHFVHPLPLDHVPTAVCLGCMRIDDVRRFTVCDACEHEFHPECLSTCDKCEALVCITDEHSCQGVAL